MTGIDASELRTGPLRLAPGLEVFLNGETRVNVQRAELSGRVQADSRTIRRSGLRDQTTDTLATADELGVGESRTVATPDPPATRFSTFVYVDENASADVFDNAARRLAARADGVTRSGNVFTAVLTGEDLAAIRRGDEAWDFVSYVEPGETISFPTPIISAAGVSAPNDRDREVSARSRIHNHGAEVLVGIIDVQGFDFGHQDFLADGKTRWDRIWDQGGSLRPSPAVRASTVAARAAMATFDYGSEIQRADMDTAIDRAGDFGLQPTDLERQSQMAPGSHATHVASIAAGNRGVARRAVLAGVLISLPDDDEDRRLSLYDSSRIAHAIDYLLAVGDELGLPVSINISLGTNGHAHDASSALSRWVDHALASPGRSVCVAAGNAGQTEPTSPSDFGFVMGRVHTNGHLDAAGLITELGWNVVGNQIMDISENEMEIWYSGQDRIAVEVKPPGGDWIGPIEPGSHLRNHQLDDLTMLSVFSETFHPANGANRIGIYLSPFFAFSASGGARVVGVKAGEWKVRLRGREIRDGRYHAWIERDDPRRLGAIGDREAWNFPSFFSRDTFTAEGTVSSLACGQRVLSVANLTGSATTVNTTSSRGPTRDGREKPDLGAVGTGVVAADGFSDGGWIAMDGTSMASPYVAGVCALMLGIDPELTAAQMASLLRRTAQPLPGHDFTWRKDAGFGAINASEAVEEAVRFRDERRRGFGQ